MFETVGRDVAMQRHVRIRTWTRQTHCNNTSRNVATDLSTHRIEVELQIARFPDKRFIATLPCHWPTRELHFVSNDRLLLQLHDEEYNNNSNDKDSNHRAANCCVQQNIVIFFCVSFIRISSTRNDYYCDRVCTDDQYMRCADNKILQITRLTAGHA